MGCQRMIWLVGPLVALACAGTDRRTLSTLHGVEPDLAEVQVENSLDQAMLAYRRFLEETPESALTPEAMRRLADLKLEKEYGLLGDGELVELPAPERPSEAAASEGASSAGPAPAKVAERRESLGEFERRASGADPLPPGESAEPALPGSRDASGAGPLEAIALYDQILTQYPHYPHNDRVLYQKARAFDELARSDEAIEVIEELVARYPRSRYVAEVQFRRAEYFFVRKDYLDAEESYAAVVRMGAGSEYYELALYKLGWTFYKQELHEEALAQYVALLDYKVSTGYDFDQSEDESDERRIADTYRVISLSFSSLGGPEAVSAYFVANGSRSYEDRIYAHLGEFYLEKLRYHDAAKSYGAFVDLYPLHRVSPHFGMRIVEIYEAGGFPRLVLDAKKDFAARYGLGSEYWRHYEAKESPEVIAYVKSNLEDLASHYHALYQLPEQADEKAAHLAEALHWYRSYLASFPGDPETPALHYRLADLLLENEDFGTAAREYEHTAYDYSEHEKAAAAGYAAIYAHREHEERAAGAPREEVRRAAVASTLRFVDRFPSHEHAAVVFSAAVEDLYDMGDFERAIATGRRLLDGYPDAKDPVRRSAWAVVAHASFDTQAYPESESAYLEVLELTPKDDEARQGVVDNLAASIYKQGEQASAAEDHRAAADHFLRIARVAPSSEIRPAAEYDAGAALIRLEDWKGAVAVLDSFRRTHSEHPLHREATKQIALIHRQQGELALAAAEYERVAGEAEDAELRSEALLVAGELYQDSERDERALAVYLRYVEHFPDPVELAVETRARIAAIHEARGEEALRREQLRHIVASDAAAGAARTPRLRYLAATSALVLSEGLYDEFAGVALVQPFDANLREKRRRMEVALAAFERLVDYEVGEVTAAATFYMAEVYLDFSRDLLGSERPGDLTPDELADYELVLEEEAYPFEERAIDVHEKNVELMRAGVYNPWIEKSLAALARVMPGRYAKFEASTGWLDSIDTYAYRAPNAPEPLAAEAEVAAAPGAERVERRGR